VGDSHTEGFGRPFGDELEEIAQEIDANSAGQGPVHAARHADQADAEIGALEESFRFNAQDQAFMEQGAQREHIVEIHPILKLIFQGYAGLLLLAAGVAWIAVMAVIVVGLVELAQRVV
jgi:hypothetical protein